MKYLMPAILLLFIFGGRGEAHPDELSQVGINQRDPFDLPDEAKEALIEDFARDIAQQKKSRLKGQPTKFEAELSLPELDIQGVVLSGSPQAIINNRVMVVGDEISGVVIVDIKKTEIIVKFGEELYTIPVKR